MEEKGEIRTSVYASIGETEEEAERKFNEIEKRTHAVTITYFQTEPAIILLFFIDMNIVGEIYKKGTLVIYEPEGIKIEVNPEQYNSDNEQEKIGKG